MFKWQMKKEKPISHGRIAEWSFTFVHGWWSHLSKYIIGPILNPCF
jgi:hypothetical protein